MLIELTPPLKKPLNSPVGTIDKTDRKKVSFKIISFTLLFSRLTWWFLPIF